MKNSALKKLSACAISLLFSVTAYSGGGGGGGGGGNDNSGQLPAPDTCNSNCGYEIGPNPSLSFVRASSGPLPVATSNVASSVNGFGGGTIYYPTNISTEMGTISIAPGFTNTRSAIAWWGPILASHGFVVKSF